MALSLSLPITGAVLSGLLAFIPNPAIAQLGLAGSTGLAGYAAAARTSKGKGTRQGDRERKALHELRLSKDEARSASAKLSKLTEDHQRLQQSHQLAVKQLEDIGEKYRAANNALSAKHEDYILKAQASQHAKELATERDRSAAELAKLTEQLAESEQLLRQEQGINSSRLAQIKAEFLATPSRLNELRAEADRLREKCAEWESHFDGTVSEADAAINTLSSKQQANVELGNQELQRLISRIAELEDELNKPPRFGGTGAADVMGDKVIDFFRSKGYIMHPHETDPDLDKGLLVSLEPKTPVDLETVSKLMGELEVFTKTFSKPKATYEGRCYRIRLAVNEPFRPADESKLTSRIDRLKKAIDLANHLAIFGGSGSGKSTFLDNAIWCGKCLWPDSGLDLLDPKYPFTEWSSLKPTHKGGEATVDGVISISKAMNDRLKDARTAMDETGQVPSYERYIFAIDEATVALTEAKRLDQVERKGDKLAVNFGASLSSLLRLGRALNVKGYFLTQSLLVSKVGLNDGDYDNATRIYLNAMIDKALDGELKELFSEGKIAAIRRELQRRKDAKHEYIGLVADTNRDEIFLFEPPTPGYFYDQYQQENSTPLPPAESPQRTSAQKSANPAKPLAAMCTDDAEKRTDDPSTDVAHSSAQPSADPSARCPKCQERSDSLDRKTVDNKGRYRFKCQNDACQQKTFSAMPTV